MNKFLLYSVAALVILSSCKKESQAKARELAKAGWLHGRWINESQFGDLSESWQKENDSVYRGQSYFIKGKDTIHQESIVLAERNGVVVYSPTVRGQNNDKPVDFKMTSATGNVLVFENPSHDFPQKIVYRKITADSLVAEISGVQQGKPTSEKFPMHRQK